MEPSDEALMAAYVRGDTRAFDVLYQRYAGYVLAVMRRGMRDQAVAEDLAQQTFLQLHRARNDFRQGESFRAWVVTIALNLKRSHLRRPVRTVGGVDVEAFAADRHAGEDEGRGAEAAVRAAIATLPEGQRQVVEKHWLEDKSFPEVAAELGLGLSAVKVRAHRAYGALRGALAAHQGVTVPDPPAYEGKDDGSEAS